MLTQNITQMVFGSAVSAFGFSLGRDVYKTAKKNDRLWFIAFALGFFFGGLFISRNYDSLLRGIGYRVLGAGMIVIASIVPIALYREFGVLFAGVLVVAGLVVGFAQRGKRRRAWQVQKENASFLVAHGLEEVDDGLVDADGVFYRLLEASSREISFMPTGRRGRRGFLKLDETGRMRAWTGMVKI